MQEDQQQKEMEAMGRIVHAMRNYYQDASWEVNRWETNYGKLSDNHKLKLQHIPTKIKAARQAIQLNQQFFNLLLSGFDPDSSGSVPQHFAEANAAGEQYGNKNQMVSAMDSDKVRYVLKNLVRDWSQEGEPERKQSYGRIVEEVVRIFGSRKNDNDQSPPPPRILVPGTGLGRLPLELAHEGFEAQGNEFSYYMLLTASFMLNQAANFDGQMVVFPWMHSNCNQLSDADQIRPVKIPDINSAEFVARPGLLSMCAGDFVEVYNDKEMYSSFDCVTTCFFIDTAHNIIQYLEIIYDILKDGGYWVNLGPLLYHWADSHTYLSSEELSIEVPLNDVVNIATGLGFKLIKQEMVPAAYLANVRSMYQTVYRCAFWTMQKTSVNSEKTSQLNTKINETKSVKDQQSLPIDTQ
eukprot:TRINITY_DN8955_c0_g1_i1.p1 TRINITY_DN8955_c0_g1~~TRINITY_DN8955_c0_g1_i1.p1  ORF type:complete len:446 (-),score=33.14 TRINITY_DN8955_c0_g1_i1:380-1606(-)